MVKIKDSYNDNPVNIYFSAVGERKVELVIDFEYPKEKMPTMTLSYMDLDEMLNLRNSLNEMIKRVTGL